ncbi:LysR family transcriptional regulator [Streptomyces lincolnensis]|uniref:LysR family transcriptional regulator n=1 Tax=Streptomyces lincolnensis TaxID=1915 RepID=UPI001E4EC9EB|nr:LysR family transcriptional regulator [Streptomyces lincolnensis]MCD7438024.1 LysR family transcriptional regulator [Streptomyces lincolnensis]
MELRDVETFLEVARVLHFGRAAERLHVTQGRVSQIVKGLEREVGGALFERSSRRVRLTPLGERFRVGAADGYDRLTVTLRECRAVARQVGDRLRIGYQWTMGGQLTDRLVSAFTGSHPHCEVVVSSLVFRAGGNLVPLAGGSDVDLVLRWSPGGDGTAVEAPGLVVGPLLASVPRGVLVPAAHPLARRRAIVLDDLLPYELLRLPDTLGAPLQERWTPTRTSSGRLLRHTDEDMSRLMGNEHLPVEDVLALVARGRGLHLTITGLLDRVPFPGLVVVPVRDMPPMVVVPVWQAARENATIRAFVESAVRTTEADRAVLTRETAPVATPVTTSVAASVREGAR